MSVVSSELSQATKPCPKCGYYNAVNVAGCYDCGAQFIERPELGLDALIELPKPMAMILIILSVVFLLPQVASWLATTGSESPGTFDDSVGSLSKILLWCVLGMLGLGIIVFVVEVLYAVIKRRRFDQEFKHTQVGVLRREEEDAATRTPTLADRTKRVQKALEETNDSEEQTALNDALRQLNEQRRTISFVLNSVELKRWQNKTVHVLRNVAKGKTVDIETARKQIEELGRDGQSIRGKIESAASDNTESLLDSYATLEEALAEGLKVLRRRNITQLVTDAANGIAATQAEEKDSLLDPAQLEAESCRQLLRLVESDVKGEQEFAFARAAALNSLHIRDTNTA